jgi:vacuolar-type H+-ATPase subunit H
MDDTEILQHLLIIEEQAATLVDDAQAEADRRIKEAEEQNHIIYDQSYQQLIEKLDAGFQETADAVKKDYDRLLDEYMESLKNMPRQNEAFSALAFSFLVEGGCSSSRGDEHKFTGPLAGSPVRFPA